MRSDLLEQGQVCLTFDDGPGVTVGDGPGPRTVDLAEYLHDEGIEATFFMCGIHVLDHPDVPARVQALGHGIGNHSHRHPELTACSADELRSELRSCLDALRAVGADDARLPFRPPYGAWDPAAAAALDADPLLSATVSGVYGWDVDGGPGWEDWNEWGRGGSAYATVASVYAEQIVTRGSAVVLMHDSTADPGEPGRRRRAGNRTLDAVRLLVPALRQRGLVFVPLPELPGLPEPPELTELPA